MSADILVIGYGNELRGDDAVGPRIAARVAEWQLPQLRVLICQQLTPELAATIGQACAVIFIDASLEVQGAEIQTVAVSPTMHVSSPVMAHVGDPASLLGLAQTLYGRIPPAWCIHVPVETFELGQPLSELAERGLSTAVEEVRRLYALCMAHETISGIGT